MAPKAVESAMRYVQIVAGRPYFRRRGFPSRPLKSPIPPAGEEAGSAMAAEVEAILAELKPARAMPGTLGLALRAYELQSADFAALAPSTRKIYLYLMKELNEDFGRLAVGTFTSAYILRLRDAWADRGHRACALRLQVLKNVLWPSVVDGAFGGADPFALVPGPRRPADAPEPHILWPIEAVRAVIAAALKGRRYGLARAVAIARFTGARRGDLVRLTRAARLGGRFRFLSGKRRVVVDIPEDPELAAVLDATPSAAPQDPRRGRKTGPASARPAGVATLNPFLVYTVMGEAYTEGGLGAELCKLIAAEHKAGRIASKDYDLHGLRHTRGVELAMAGCTDAEGAAQMGHASAASFAQYRRQADRIRMSDHAADKVARLRERPANIDVKADVQRT